MFSFLFLSLSSYLERRVRRVVAVRRVDLLLPLVAHLLLRRVVHEGVAALDHLLGELGDLYEVVGRVRDRDEARVVERDAERAQVRVDVVLCDHTLFTPAAH